MKKFLATIVVFSYLLMSSGIVVNFHYCMNKLASTTLFAKKSKVCSRCGMKMHKGNGCCHDETTVVKLQTEHNKAQVSHEIAAPVPVINHASDFIVAEALALVPSKHFLNHSPPLIPSQDRYLQNCVFRI